jgi:dynein heavy chain 1
MVPICFIFLKKNFFCDLLVPLNETPLFCVRSFVIFCSDGDETKGREGLEHVLTATIQRLDMLADTVFIPLSPTMRKKIEQILTEIVHHRDVTRSLIKKGVYRADDFEWLYQMRLYWNSSEADPMQKLSIKVADSSFHYGFEYLGLAEKLVQTPLTDRVYLTLCQALWTKMGGAPFGPAGTGKTETVKMLGAQLGRFVLTFNCDENFDFKSMGRIFVGLCQVGAWGCFDEFNRLEERMLSAVSQQILTIQTGIRNGDETVELLGRNSNLNSNVGIFVTMNPGYAGRLEFVFSFLLRIQFWF